MNNQHSTPKVHPAYQSLYGKPTDQSTAEQSALDAAHSRFACTPKQQREYINANIHHLSIDDLKELVAAITAQKAGDKGALKRLVQVKQTELAELQAQLEGGES